MTSSILKIHEQALYQSEILYHSFTWTWISIHFPPKYSLSWKSLTDHSPGVFCDALISWYLGVGNLWRTENDFLLFWEAGKSVLKELIPKEGTLGVSLCCEKETEKKVQESAGCWGPSPVCSKLMKATPSIMALSPLCLDDSVIS